MKQCTPEGCSGVRDRLRFGLVPVAVLWAQPLVQPGHLVPPQPAPQFC